MELIRKLMKHFETPPYKIVMLVDDNTVEHFIVEKFMSSVKFCSHLIKFTSAIDALHYLEKYADDKDMLPQLIFVDINMPGMSGFDFLSVYENMNTATDCYRVIVLSSTTSESEIQQASNHPCVTKFIEKPLTKDKLMALGKDI